MRRGFTLARRLVLAAALLVAGAAPAAEPIVTTDLLRIRSVSSIDVAWDGARAALAVRSIGRVEAGDGERAVGGAPDVGGRPEYVNQSHLYLLDLTGTAGRWRRLTFGDRLDHSPVFSQDGRRIAFVRGRTDDAQGAADQVWVMPVDGGEARQITWLEGGARSPRWSPDGRTVLVTSRVAREALPGTPPWPSERPKRDWDDAGAGDVEPSADGTPREIRAWLDENEAAGDPVVATRLDFQEEQSLRHDLAFDQLFLADASEVGAAPVRVTRRFNDHRSAEFMPDGLSIVYAARQLPDRHPDRVLESSIWRIGADGADDREILSLEGWSVQRVKPSRDGSVLAFTAVQMDQPAYRPSQLGIASIKNGAASEPVWLTGHETFDASVSSFAWNAARSALIFNAPVRGGVPLMTMGLGLLEPAALVERENGFPVGVHAFAAGGGAIVYDVTEPGNPCVVRVRDGRGDRLALDLNPWVAEKEVSLPTAGHVTRPDGTTVEYWLMEPTRRAPERTCPLALEIHGGPGGMWGPGEFTMWHEFQLLCSRGYAVVYANPRGSGGYGYDFARANYQDWGEGPAGDVLAVVDQALLNEWLDAQRLVVTGGSYGGYLTAWIIAHDHRFRAAVAQRGVYDLTTFFGEGNAWRLVEWSMGGPPWDARARPVLQRESPFTFVHRIQTPLLIMHASDDLRTGVSQSEMLYRALKRLDRPVEYVRYPDAGHELSRSGDPHQRMDRLDRIIEFFDRYVDREAASQKSATPIPGKKGGE